MSIPPARSFAVRTAVAVTCLTLGLTACGGGSGEAATTTPVAASTGAPAADGAAGGAGAGQGGPGGVDFAAVQSCLTAAGIDLPTPSGGPRGTDRPTDRPTARPSGAPNGGNGGGGGGRGGMFQDPEVQAALTACGITLPTGRGGPRPTTTPTSA